MIPPHESTILLLTAADASDLADGGEVAGGYLLLLRAAERAEAAATVQEPWAGALRNHYLRVLDRYTQRYHLADSHR